MTKLFLACPECGQRFERKHHRAQFCSPQHAKLYNNRQLARGQSIVGLAQAWRGARSSRDAGVREAAKMAFAQLCRELDTFNAEDRGGGRVSATQVYRRRVAAGLLD